MQEKNIAEINNAIISLLKKINRKDQQQNMVSDIEELWKLLKNFGKIFPEDIVNQYSEFFDSFEGFLQNCKSIGFLEENMQMMISSLDLLFECIQEIRKYFDEHSQKCACCNSKVLYLETTEGKSICPDCGANNSDRLIISFLQKEELQKAAEGYKVLYVLPTAAVSAWIQINCPHIKYVTVDFLAQITDFAVTDTTFDLVIYSPKMWNAHEEEERLREIKRLLNEDGKCIYRKTIESQNDVGSLGGIFYEKCLGEDYFDQGVFEKQGLKETDKLYVLTKESNVSLNMAEQYKVDPDLLENGPLVSVIMSCYNHEQFVEEAILSVLNQTYKNIEFIVADDGSSDHSAEIMKKYSQFYAYEYYSRENTGGLYNNIKKQATGKYIALMNSDDVWEVNKIASQVDYMENHPNCGVCLTWCKYVDEDRNEIDDTIFIKGNRDSYQWMNYFWRHGNALCNPSFLAIRKFGLEDVRFGAACRQLPDFFKWVQFIQETQIHIIPKVFVEMRRHHNGLTENVSASTKENTIRHVLEAGCNWMWIIRQMDNIFFKKAFSDLMIDPNAETEEEIKCEKYFLMLNSKNFAVQYEAFCYINEIYKDTSACFNEKYHYDYRDIAKDIINKGIGKLIAY